VRDLAMIRVKAVFVLAVLPERNSWNPFKNVHGQGLELFWFRQTLKEVYNILVLYTK
jgi:hypothetical protein